jgi:hypothetical protein
MSSSDVQLQSAQRVVLSRALKQKPLRRQLDCDLRNWNINLGGDRYMCTAQLVRKLK